MPPEPGRNSRYPRAQPGAARNRPQRHQFGEMPAAAGHRADAARSALRPAEAEFVGQRATTEGARQLAAKVAPLSGATFRGRLAATVKNRWVPSAWDTMDRLELACQHADDLLRQRGSRRLWRRLRAPHPQHPDHGGGHRYRGNRSHRSDPAPPPSRFATWSVPSGSR